MQRSQPIQWDWSNALNPSTFRWRYGRTPLSSLQTLAVAWALYLGGIFLLWLWMRSRPKFEMSTFSLWHNRILMYWSALMFGGIVWGMLALAMSGSSRLVFCVRPHEAFGPVFYFGGYMYYVSKYYELLDTVIIVLRKAPLTFLHVYHHSIVILLTWAWMQYDVAIGVGLGSAFNTFVHIWMYRYYALRIEKKQVWYKRYLTQLQIVQFVSSFVLSLPYLYYDLLAPALPGVPPLAGGHNCTGFDAFVGSAAVNLSFLLLFIRFYVNSYGAKAGKDD